MTPEQILSRPWLGLPATGPMLRPSEAARYLGLSRSQYYAGATDGRFPEPISISARASGVPRAWLDAVIARRAAGRAAA